MDGQLPLPMWYLDVGIINPWGLDGIVGLGQKHFLFTKPVPRNLS
jgi:hypothetical protein